MNTQEQDELVQVITDFIELGHVENIVSMFKQDTSCYELTGRLVQDERFMVRIGVAVLFEELHVLRPDEIELAVPNLTPLLSNKNPQIRGEAANLLGIIGSKGALGALTPLQNDPDPQVKEIVTDILANPDQ